MVRMFRIRDLNEVCCQNTKSCYQILHACFFWDRNFHTLVNAILASYDLISLTYRYLDFEKEIFCYPNVVCCQIAGVGLM